MNGFESFHPAVIFIYYVLVVCFSMVSMHPVVILASLVGGFLFFAALNNLKKMISELVFFFFLFVIMAVTNPIFVHNGETILFFMNDNPVTLEAMIYGGMSSLMIVGVLLWCRCYSAILTTDKFLYLFGKLIPKLGLILSMAFRFIPLFKHQMQRINRSQKTMGLYATDSVPDKIRGGVRVFDSLISWSMENSIDTADAMKARGYGLGGRTNFSLFQFQSRDKILLVTMGLFTVFIVLSYVRGGYDFYYYPYVAQVQTTPKDMLQYTAALIFMLIPGIIEVRGKLTSKYLESKIQSNQGNFIFHSLREIH